MSESSIDMNMSSVDVHESYVDKSVYVSESSVDVSSGWVICECSRYWWVICIYASHLDMSESFVDISRSSVGMYVICSLLCESQH